MEEKIKFTEEEIKEIISSIEAAPIDGYGSMAKNRSVYTAPYRKLVALIYAKILSSIEISSKNISTVAEQLNTSIESLFNASETHSANNEAQEIAIQDLQDGKLDKTGGTINGTLTVKSQKGVFVTDNGENGTAYDDGAIVNQGKRIVIPLKEGTMALAEDMIAGVELQLFELDYKLTVRARAADTRILSENTIDLPLESMVVGGAYNDITQRIELTLKNGNVVSFPVDELVNGLISSSEKGQPNGVASLDAEGKVPKEQLPDDIGGGGASSDLTNYVKFTDYASYNKAGTVRTSNTRGTHASAVDGTLQIEKASKDEIDTATNNYKPIVASTYKYAVKKGITTNTETLTDEEKTSACEWIGAVKSTAGIYLVYGRDRNGDENPWNASYSANSNTVMIRDGNARSRVEAPISEKDIANKQYVDNNFVAKTTDALILYGTDSNGNQTTWVLRNTNNTKNTIAGRDSNGNIQVGTAVNPTDAVNLGLLQALITQLKADNNLV